MDNQKIPLILQVYSQRLFTGLSKKEIIVKEIFAILHALSTWLLVLAWSRPIFYKNNTCVFQDHKYSSIVKPAIDSFRIIAMISATHDIIIEF